MTRVACFAFLALLLLAGPPGASSATPAPQGTVSADAAREAAPDPLMTALQARMQKLATLRGRFVQRLESRGLGRARVESGTFAIRKPAFMRWDYQKPEKKLAVTDGETTWLHLPEDNEVHVGRYPQGGDAAASSLLAGRLKLDEGFHARRLTAAESGPPGVAGGVAIELTPREPQEEFEALVITVDPKTLMVRRLTVQDTIGGRMTFDFFDLEENAVLDDTLFRFETPRGAEVIDTR